MNELQSTAINDLSLAPLAAWLCILVSLALLRFAPGGIACIGFTLSGLGGAAILGDQRFAMVAVLLSAMAVAVSAFLAVGRPRSKEGADYVPPSARLFLILLAILWVKIAADCLTGGTDDYRLEALRTALIRVLMPFLILALRIRAVGTLRAGRELAIGFTALGMAYLLPLVPNLLFGGRIWQAFSGDTRLIVYGLDTINSARMMFFGCLGAFILASDRSPIRFRKAYYALAAAFFAGLLLNQSRQFLVATVVTAVLGFLAVRRVAASRIIAGAVTSALLGVAILYFHEDTGGSRFSREELINEVNVGRGDIWAQAIRAGMENPLTGDGFRGFGQEQSTFSIATEEMTVTKDSAHGFLQEVVAEHGVVLGLAMTFATLWCLVTLLRISLLKVGPHGGFPIIALIAGLIVPELFSGGASNAWSFYLLGVFCMDRRPSGPDSQRQADGPQSPDLDGLKPLWARA